MTIETLGSIIAYHRWWGFGIWFFEDLGRTIQFDASRGYRLTTTPSRGIRITNGVVEYIGTTRGNCQGFPDRDDFGPRRQHSPAKRIAVFGDSFTSAQYLGQNWPDRAEDLARERGQPIHFLNFAVFGGGLANWWSVLLKVVKAERYEIDGVIFAVFGNDLQRRFTIAEDRGAKQYMLTLWPSWNPATYPETLEEARPFLRSVTNSYILSAEEFERLLQGQWPPSVPRYYKPIFASMAWRLMEPHLSRASQSLLMRIPGVWRLKRLKSLLMRIPGVWRLRLDDDVKMGDQPPVDHASENYRTILINDIRTFIESRCLKTMVVYIPEREELLNAGRGPSQNLVETMNFAKAIGATFLDGRRIFQGMSPAKIRAHYLPYEGHWNQAGSNRFADFVMSNLCVFML